MYRLYFGIVYSFSITKSCDWILSDCIYAMDCVYNVVANVSFAGRRESLCFNFGYLVN